MVKLRKTIFHNLMRPIISVVWIAPTISAITIIAHETWESIQNTYYALYFYYCNKCTVESFRSISWTLEMTIVILNTFRNRNHISYSFIKYFIVLYNSCIQLSLHEAEVTIHSLHFNWVKIYIYSYMFAFISKWLNHSKGNLFLQDCTDLHKSTFQHL